MDAKSTTTAAAKREVREALRFAGFAFTSLTAGPTHINVNLKDAADRPAVLQMFPDATAPESANFPRTVLIPR